MTDNKQEWIEEARLTTEVMIKALAAQGVYLTGIRIKWDVDYETGVPAPKVYLTYDSKTDD